MAESFTQLAPDSTGKKLRYRSRTVGANTVWEPYLIRLPTERVTTFRGFVSNFRMIGNTSTFLLLFVAENAIASGVYVAIRELTFTVDSTALLATVDGQIEVSVWTGSPTVTAFTALPKGSLDTSLTSDANVTMWSAATAEGGSANPSAVVTGTAPLQSGRTRIMRMHDLSGQVRQIHPRLNPFIPPDMAIVLRPGIGELVRVRALYSAGADNATTQHIVVNAAWEEYNL